jgi:phospholipase/lecithinase/hemolysin
MLTFASLRQKVQNITWSILGIGIFMTPVCAGAVPIVAFGDSLSDTGNFAIATNGAIPPSSFYFNGRFSNGLIWLDQVGATLGGSVEPVLAGGSNFAFGSARVATTPVSPSLRAQANAFLSASTVSGADPDALYVVFGGSNDVRDAIGSSDPIATVTTAAEQLAGIVGDLAEAGAVDIVVPTVGNIGRLPEARQGGDALVGLAGLLSLVFNQTLAQELAGIDALGDVNLIRPDFFALGESIAASPESFGLTNVTDPCLPGTPFSIPPGATACLDPDQFFFWDLQHPTTAGHALLANVALDAINAALNPVSVPEPPPSTLIAPLLLAGLIMGVGTRKCRPSRR